MCIEANFGPVETDPDVTHESQGGNPKESEPTREPGSCSPDGSPERISRTQSSDSDDEGQRLHQPKQNTPHQRKKLRIIPERVQLDESLQ